jgi:hypothetical protein
VLHHFGFNLTAREGVNVILNLFVSDCEPLSTSIKNTLPVIALSEILLSARGGFFSSPEVNENLRSRLLNLMKTLKKETRGTSCITRRVGMVSC